MQARGYLVEAELSEQALTMRGTTKIGWIALVGQKRNDGDVVVPRAEIATVDFKGANPIVNGCLTVHTTAGVRFQLHFRRKQGSEFVALARALGVADLPA